MTQKPIFDIELAQKWVPEKHGICVFTTKTLQDIHVYKLEPQNVV